jgi:hypothetical protein
MEQSISHKGNSRDDSSTEHFFRRLKRTVKVKKCSKLLHQKICFKRILKMAEKKTPPQKTPPQKNVKSIQFDLFREFHDNNKKRISNTIEIWERIPKYFPARTLKKLYPEKGHPDPFEWDYIDNNYKYTVIIRPALIKENGVYTAFFPSATEELIEESLKKILSSNEYGIHDPKKSETWVKFSLSIIFRELKENGCTRSRSEIKRSIEIMNKCNISFLKNGKEVWSGAILQDLITISRKDYLENTDSHHIARLPLFISNAINKLDYRQFNYSRLMSCNSSLSRWIYKRLIHRYKQANFINSYHFMYSDLKNSGLLQQSIEGDNRKKTLSALNELVKKDVLTRYESQNKLKNRKIIDVKYTLYPSSNFISEQKAANSRTKEITIKTKKLLSVDKS